MLYEVITVFGLCIEPVVALAFEDLGHDNRGLGTRVGDDLAQRLFERTEALTLKGNGK